MGEPGLSSYHKRLLIFLSVATFFEGYDFMALSQILPNIRAEFGLREAHAGWLVGFVNAGTVLAYVLVRRADRWGRKRVLMLTIAGYTFFTVLSGLAPDPYSFALAQFFARVFLIAEWAVSMVIAAEEFPAAKRGMVIGVIQAFSSLGAVACAGVVPLMLQSALSWRLVYFVGAVPLILLALARRGMRETQRFEALGAVESRSIFAIWKTPYKTRLIQLALIWLFTYACSQTAVTFWKEFVVAERGFTDAQAGGSITIAAVVAMPLVFLSGKLLDVIGRKPGAVVIFLVTSLGTFGSYTMQSQAALTVALTLGIFGVSAVLPVLNAFTSELFPTELRGDAFAWSNNLLGRIAYVISPIVVATAAESIGWGPAVASTAVFPIVALGLIMWWMPETKDQELEQTSAV